MSTDVNNKVEKPSETQVDAEKEICGIIMPISNADGYKIGHWQDVKLIIEESIRSAEFDPKLVSDADEVGIIHNRIVTNLFENPIVVCDVSSKNPNVMFELGLRLAFDRATIIIKDNKTDYNFDTSVIEHLPYPADLRYAEINDFKQLLAEKIKKTALAAQAPEYSTFLKHFKRYKPKLETKELDRDDYILQKLDEISKQLLDANRRSPAPPRTTNFLSGLSQITDYQLLFDEFVAFINTHEFYRRKIAGNEPLPLEDIIKDFTEFLRRNGYNKQYSVSEVAHFCDEYRKRKVVGGSTAVA